MASKIKRGKYAYFQLVTETENKTFYKYSDAFSAYHRSDESATLYGIEQYGGETIVIFSK